MTLVPYQATVTGSEGWEVDLSFQELPVNPLPLSGCPHLPRKTPNSVLPSSAICPHPGDIIQGPEARPAPPPEVLALISTCRPQTT